MAHLLIAAAHKSSGKTTISLGLAGALSRRGILVQTYKKGPDYIDPMWLHHASGRLCYNLDFNTMNNAEIVQLFTSRSKGSDLAIVESNKGLYDGVDLEGRDSNAALAKLLDAPVILVIDTTGTTRGIAPLLRGYQVFDPQINIAGVILNKVGGPRHEGKLQAAVERYTDLNVVGAIGRDSELTINERHLGLTTPKEIEQLERRLARIYDAVEAGVNVEALLGIAQSVPMPASLPVDSPLPARQNRARDVRIAIARDSAFSYYYPDDLEALENAGAELVHFNTLTDDQLPKADGLIIGGGFPETHMRALERNGALREDIRNRLAAGMPAYAECGGLMYLCNAISWRGERCEMVGFVDGEAVVGPKPQGRGYTRLMETLNHPWNHHSFDPSTKEHTAHEFHFANIENLAAGTRFAFDVTRGHGIDGRSDGIVKGNLLAGFCHMRHTAANPWVDRFVDHVRRCRKN